MRLISTSMIAVLLTAVTGRGDMLTTQNMGNTIVPRQERDISMDAETVRIVPLEEDEENQYALGYMVFCEFVLTSHSNEAITRDMAFPISDSRDARWLAKGFRASRERDGKREPLETTLQVLVKAGDMRHMDIARRKAQRNTFDYPAYITWKQTFEPGETQIVRCEYSMGDPRYVYPDHPFTGVVFEYVVRTGSLWKGRIGEATIKLYLGQPRVYSDKIAMTYPDSVQWKVSGNALIWHFTDWEPTEDIRVAFTRWTGYDVNDVVRNGFRLPEPYLGAQEEYTKHHLDRLVERDVQRMGEYYPERAQNADRNFLRSMAAEHLFYELFARHGDPFILGPTTDANLSKYRGRYGSHSDYFIYSRWHGYFKGYSYHGGWYRYFESKWTEPNPAVTLDDLSPIERKNAAFLRGFVKRPLLR